MLQNTLCYAAITHIEEKSDSKVSVFLQQQNCPSALLWPGWKLKTGAFLQQSPFNPKYLLFKQLPEDWEGLLRSWFPCVTRRRGGLVNHNSAFSRYNWSFWLVGRWYLGCKAGTNLNTVWPHRPAEGGIEILGENKICHGRSGQNIQPIVNNIRHLVLLLCFLMCKQFQDQSCFQRLLLGVYSDKI